MAARDHISDNQFHLHLFHATPTENVESIKARGLGPNPYLTNDYSLAEHYAENQWDDTPTSIITVRANPRNLIPDYNSFAEPVYSYYQPLHRDFDEERLRSDTDWKNSLKYSGAVKHVGTIAPHNILNIESYDDYFQDNA